LTLTQQTVNLPDTPREASDTQGRKDGRCAEAVKRDLTRPHDRTLNLTSKENFNPREVETGRITV
jgi:hypothetical protein